MAKQATSTDVARRAGVSQSTVSFVLNHRQDKSVAIETRQRVLDAANALRYRSNRLSEGILRGRSGIIGVSIPEFQDHYYGGILAGICDQIESSGASVLLIRTNEDAHSEADSVNRFMEFRVEGIISVAHDWGTDTREVWLEEVQAKNIPIVIVDDRNHAAIADCVVTDDVRGARLAVEHLIEQGHRRIAHISGNCQMSTAKDRLTGYKQALERAGIEVDLSRICGNNYNVEAAEIASNAILSLSELPTAVFASSDMLAVHLMKKMTHLGIRCPEDIAICGYSDDNLAEAFDLTSVAQHPREIGAASVRELFNRIADPDAAPLARTMPTKLVRRASTDLTITS